MWYAIHAVDIKNTLNKRLANRPKHLERLKMLQNKGKLFIAGPFPAIDSNNPGESGFTGSLIIAEFDSLNDAKKWVQNDPYFINGVYKNVDVRPFKKSLP